MKLTGYVRGGSLKQVHRLICIDAKTGASCSIFTASTTCNLGVAFFFVALVDLTLAAVENILKGTRMSSLLGSFLATKISSQSYRRGPVLAYLFFVFAFLGHSGFLPLSSIFPLFDIDENLSRLILSSTRIYIFPAKAANHALKDVPHLLLEVVLVVM